MGKEIELNDNKEDEKVDEDDGLEMNCSISDDSIIKLS